MRRSGALVALCAVLVAPLAARPAEITLRLDPAPPAGSAATADLRVILPEGIEVVELRPAGDWQIWVYVDPRRVAPATLQRAVRSLRDTAPALLAIGDLSLVVQDGFADVWLERSRDLEEVTAAFDDLADLEAVAEKVAPDEAGRGLLDALVPLGAGAARALIVVGDVASQSPLASVRSPTGPEGSPRRARAEPLAPTLAALGWTVFPFQDGNRTAADDLAADSGGVVLQDAAALRALPGDLASRWVGTLRMGDDPRWPAPMRLAASPGRQIVAPRWAPTSLPSWSSVARARRLLDEGDEGDLEVTAFLRQAGGDQALVESSVGIEAEGWADSSRLRWSLVGWPLDGGPIVFQVDGRGLLLDGSEAWAVEARLGEAMDDLNEVVVVVEELSGGLWGATEPEWEGSLGMLSATTGLELVDFGPSSSSAVAGADSTGEEERLIRILPPRGGRLAGRQTFSAMSANDFIRRVEFWLDGVKQAESKAPFSARLDLGAEVEPHEIRVVAFDRLGAEIGTDSLVVNEEARRFAVHLRSARPAPGSPANLEIEADVETAAGGGVERVEFYWNESLRAVRSQPPWSAAIDVTAPTGADFVRVVAYDADGFSVEDVRLLGGDVGFEEVDVNLVEVYSVVTDKEGRPVADLPQESFQVLYRGREVPLQRFEVATEVPLALGIVIDTSESMMLLMEETRRAALGFLAEMLTERDEAFVVDFDSEPRLAQGLTRDSGELLRALASLQADGNTALYDAVLFSLLQFETETRRRALVLLTDGDDYGSRFSAKRAAQQARGLAVPVYLISLAGLDSLRPAFRKGDLEAIAEHTGGRVFYVEERGQLSGTYARIGAELRSQYLLAFATDEALGDDDLDRIEVEVRNRALEVRSVVAGRLVQ